MVYTQKYCLVSFIHSVDNQIEFRMTDWPLHITLVDVFAVDLTDKNIKLKLATLLSNHSSIKTSATTEAILGTTEVVLLKKNIELDYLHASLVDLLEEYGAEFNNPEFTKEGFIPHCTIKEKEQLENGEEVVISTISIVDMFPGGNWQRRKILGTFNLNVIIK